MILLAEQHEYAQAHEAYEAAVTARNRAEEELNRAHDRLRRARHALLEWAKDEDAMTGRRGGAA